MASWADLRAADPELAAIGAERLLGPGLVMVGTRRANGWARLSPVEPLEVDGVLYLGMIWQSYKALDLLRDPKVSIQSVVTRADGIEGDVKLYGPPPAWRTPDPGALLRGTLRPYRLAPRG